MAATNGKRRVQVKIKRYQPGEKPEAVLAGVPGRGGGQSTACSTR